MTLSHHHSVIVNPKALTDNQHVMHENLLSLGWGSLKDELCVIKDVFFFHRTSIKEPSFYEVQ